MAKFQLCMFQRKEESANWERGIAKVKAFGLHDITCIVDEDGNKVEEVWNYELLADYAHTTTIDTETAAVFAGRD